MIASLLFTVTAAASIVIMSDGLPFEAVWRWPDAHAVVAIAIIAAMLA